MLVRWGRALNLGVYVTVVLRVLLARCRLRRLDLSGRDMVIVRGICY